MKLAEALAESNCATAFRYVDGRLAVQVTVTGAGLTCHVFGETVLTAPGPVAVAQAALNVWEPVYNAPLPKIARGDAMTYRAGAAPQKMPDAPSVPAVAHEIEKAVDADIQAGKVPGRRGRPPRAASAPAKPAETPKVETSKPAPRNRRTPPENPPAPVPEQVRTTPELMRASHTLREHMTQKPEPRRGRTPAKA